MHPSHRDTIFVEDALILTHTEYEGDQYVLSVRAPDCASHAMAGQFAHLQCAPSLPMRRPLSIMRVNPAEGRVDFLYKTVGVGTRELAKRKAGESISLMGPIGKPFTVHSERSRPLLIGGGVGIPPMVFLAESLKNNAAFTPLVIMGSEVPFPFTTQPSTILTPGMPDGVIASMPLLEDWEIPSRLASLQGYPGCYDGYISELAGCWLDSLSQEKRNQIEIFACGPHPMLAATAALAREYAIPCQVSLEEYMACAVGGCAGCVVKVTTDTGTEMKKVCVDGPVFEASSVF
ncbi:MAG: dihydroorotate dehydrogenase electron transfer subunit [Gammaproteobacteria bacterium]